MKKKLALLLILPGFLGIHADVLDKIQIENAIKDQIKENLSLTLSPDQYLVFVGSTVKNNRVREIDSTENDKYTRKSSPPKQGEFTPRFNEDDFLPGFARIQDLRNYPLYTYNNPVDEEKEYKKERYSYIDDVKLRSVRIVVVLDKDIPPAKTREITSSLRDKVRSSYGRNSRILFKSASLVKKPPRKSLLDHLRENPLLALLAALVGLLIILLLLLFFILCLYFFFNLLGNLLGGLFRRRERKEEPYPPQKRPPPVRKIISQPPPPQPPPPPPPPAATPERPKAEPPKEGPAPAAAAAKIDPLEAKLIKEQGFVNRFVNRPLISRKFFLELPKDERELLYNAFDSTSVQNLFEKLDPALKDLKGSDDEAQTEGEVPGEGTEETTENTLEAKNKTIDKYLRDLEHFKKITTLKMDYDFGSLSLLTKEELKAIFREIPTEDLVVLLKSIDKDIANYYISELSEDNRKGLLPELNREMANLPGDRFVDLKDRVNRAVYYIEKNVFIENPDKDILSRSLVEASTNAKAMVTDIQERDEQLYEKLKHFAYDEKDLLQEEDTYIRLLLEGIETEDIAKASFIMDEDLKNQLLGIISEERKEFVQSIIDVNRNTIKKEEAKASLNKILNSYREKKADQI